MTLLRIFRCLLLVSGSVALAQVIPGSPSVASPPNSAIIGNVATATGGPIVNGTLSFSLSQPAIVSGSILLAPQSVSCYTSTLGAVVGLPDPSPLPILAANSVSGTLAAGTYYVQIYYTSATGTVSKVSPEATVVLSSAGQIIVNPPILQPAAASGYGVAIGTSPGSETIQGTVTGWAPFTQSTALDNGGIPSTTNTSACNLYFSDALIPTGTYYTVTLVNQNGIKIAGFPQDWCTYGGSGGVINISNGAPTGNCNVNGVFYPTPIFAVPATGAAQSINGPLTINGVLSACVDLGMVEAGSSCYPTVQAAINALPGGGTVVIPPGLYACPTSISSNIALIGLGASADASYIASIGIFPANTVTQVTIGPCNSPISIPLSSKNIRFQNLTLDFNNSGNGLSFTNPAGVQLFGVSIINAGNNSTPALAFRSVDQNSARNVVEHTTINCNQSSAGANFCQAAIYLGSTGVGAVTLNTFEDISISGSLKCGIELEKNSDTNNWFGGAINPDNLTAGSAFFCFNLLNPTVDVDANANFFSGWSGTGNTTYVWNAGQSSGHVFLFTNSPPPPANYNVAGGSPIPPTIFTESLGVNGRVTLQTDNLVAATGLGMNPYLVSAGVSGYQVAMSATAPTISSGFGTSPSITIANGTASFHVNVGTGGAAGSGVISLPAAKNGWDCTCQDDTTISTNVFQCRAVGTSTTLVTLTNTGTDASAHAWSSGDILHVQCMGH